MTYVVLESVSRGVTPVESGEVGVLRSNGTSGASGTRGLGGTSVETTVEGTIRFCR